MTKCSRGMQNTHSRSLSLFVKVCDQPQKQCTILIREQTERVTPKDIGRKNIRLWHSLSWSVSRHQTGKMLSVSGFTHTPWKNSSTRIILRLNTRFTEICSRLTRNWHINKKRAVQRPPFSCLRVFSLRVDRRNYHWWQQALRVNSNSISLLSEDKTRNRVILQICCYSVAVAQIKNK